MLEPLFSLFVLTHSPPSALQPWPVTAVRVRCTHKPSLCCRRYKTVNSTVPISLSLSGLCSRSRRVPRFRHIVATRRCIRIQRTIPYYMYVQHTRHTQKYNLDGKSVRQAQLLYITPQTTKLPAPRPAHTVQTPPSYNCIHRINCAHHFHALLTLHAPHRLQTPRTPHTLLTFTAYAAHTAYTALGWRRA